MCLRARTAARSPPPVVDKTVRLWDAATGQPRGEPLKHDGPVYAIAFSPDGRTLATASGNFDREPARRGCGTRRPVSPAASRSNMTVAVHAVSFSPDGRTLATASVRKAVARLWDAATGQPRGEPLKHDGLVNAVSFSPDGRTLATASDGRDGSAVGRGDRSVARRAAQS